MMRGGGRRVPACPITYEALTAESRSALRSAGEAAQDICNQLVRRPPTEARLTKAARKLGAGMQPLQQHLHQVVEVGQRAHGPSAKGTWDLLAAVQQQTAQTAVALQLIPRLVKIMQWVGSASNRQGSWFEALLDAGQTLQQLLQLLCPRAEVFDVDWTSEREGAHAAVLQQAVDAGVVPVMLTATKALAEQWPCSNSQEAFCAVGALRGIMQMVQALVVWDTRAMHVPCQPISLAALGATSIIDDLCSAALALHDVACPHGIRNSNNPTAPPLQALTDYAVYLMRFTIVLLSGPLAVLVNASLAGNEAECLPDGRAYAPATQQLCAAALQRPSIAHFVRDASGAQLADCKPRPGFSSLLPSPRFSNNSKQYLCQIANMPCEQHDCVNDFVVSVMGVHCTPAAPPAGLLDVRTVLLYLEALVCIEEPVAMDYAVLGVLLWRLDAKQYEAFTEEAVPLLVQVFARVVDAAIAARDKSAACDVPSYQKEMVLTMSVLTQTGLEDNMMENFERTHHSPGVPTSVLWHVVSAENGCFLVALEKAVRAQLDSSNVRLAVGMLSAMSKSAVVVIGILAKPLLESLLASLVLSLGKWLARTAAPKLAAHDETTVPKLAGHDETTACAISAMALAAQMASAVVTWSAHHNGSNCASTSAASLNPAATSTVEATSAGPCSSACAEQTAAVMAAAEVASTQQAASTEAAEGVEQVLERFTGLRLLILCRLGGAAAHVLRVQYGRTPQSACDYHLEQLQRTITFAAECSQMISGSRGCLQLRAALKALLLPEQNAAFNAAAAAAAAAAHAPAVTPVVQGAEACASDARGQAGVARQGDVEPQGGAHRDEEDKQGVLMALEQTLQHLGMLADVQLPAQLLPGCHNPACTNMQGAQEAQLKTRKCAACGVARFCQKACQVQAWQLHRAVCGSNKQ